MLEWCVYRAIEVTVFVLVGPLVHLLENTQHGHDAIASAIGATDVAVAGTDIVNAETNASSVLRDGGTLLEGVVDAIDRVGLRGEQKA